MNLQAFLLESAYRNRSLDDFPKILHLFSCKNPEFLNIIPWPALLGSFPLLDILETTVFLKYRACKLGLMFLVSAVVSLKSKGCCINEFVALAPASRLIPQPFTLSQQSKRFPGFPVFRDLGQQPLGGSEAELNSEKRRKE